MARRLCTVLVVILFSLCGLLSCGLEVIDYIDYIWDVDVDYSDVAVTIRLPSSGAEGYDYFTHFAIFYRIYISGNIVPGRISERADMTLINATLNSDYGAILPWTDKTSTTGNTSNLENNFLNRRYYQLMLANANITSVLGSGSVGSNESSRVRMEIFFSQNTTEYPVLRLSNRTDEFPLQRANSAPGTNFRPVPVYGGTQEYRFFLNHEDLYNNTNATNEINADVAQWTSTSAPARYTYVAMYIAAVRRSSDMPPRSIYSQPTFLGVFRLTDGPRS